MNDATQEERCQQQFPGAGWARGAGGRFRWYGYFSGFAIALRSSALFPNFFLNSADALE